MICATLSLMSLSCSLAIEPAPEPCKETVLVTIRATGIGHPPPRMKGARARLMARRAAEVTAVRNLADKLGVGPGGKVSGFRYVAEEYMPNGSVKVTVEKTIEVPRLSAPSGIHDANP